MPALSTSNAIADRESVGRPERGGEGRSARKIVPRRALADWNPDGRGPDALTTILAQNEFRAQDLLPIRHARADGLNLTMCGMSHADEFIAWPPRRGRTSAAPQR